MYPLVIIGDLHLRDDLDGYMDAQLETVKGILLDAYKILRERFYVVFLGDIFDKRNPKVTELLKFDKFISLVLRPGNLDISEIFVLRGNHDTIDKHGTETGLSLIHGITLCKEYTKILDIGLIPHYEDPKQLQKALLYCHNCDARILVGHFGYRGCITPDGDIESDAITIDDFLIPTVLGHIHKTMVEGDVTVLGTPYSTGFAESWENHNFAIFRKDKLTLHPVRTFVNHLTLMDEDLDRLQTFNTPKNAFNLVTFIATRDSDLASVKKKLRSFASYTFTKFKDLKTDFSQHWLGSVEDLPKYVDECKTDLDPIKLKIVAEELIKEAGINENSEN